MPGSFGRVTAGAADLEAERRVRPWAELSVVGLGATLVVTSLLTAVAFRELLGPLVDLFRAGTPTDAQIDEVLDDAVARQDDYWWLNLIGLAPLAFLAGLAVWANRVATTAARLGYPARHGTGWAAGGWFVPVVNLWFPYQSIVDSLSPANPQRRQVLTWWLLFVLGGLSTLPVLAVGVLTDVNLAAVGLLPGAVAVIQAGLGLRVVALVHADHASALGATTPVIDQR